MNKSNAKLQQCLPLSVDALLRQQPGPPLERITSTFAAAERRVAATRFSDLLGLPTAAVSRSDLLSAGYLEDVSSSSSRLVESSRGSLRKAVNDCLTDGAVSDTRVALDEIRNHLGSLRGRLSTHRQARIDDFNAAQEQAHALGRQVERRRQSWLRRQMDRIWRLPINRLVRRRLQAEERGCIARCHTALAEGGLTVLDGVAQALSDEINRVRQVEHVATQVEEARDRRRTEVEAESARLPHWHEEPSGDEADSYGSRIFPSNAMHLLSTAVVRRWTESGGDLRESIEWVAREKTGQSHLPANITQYLMQLDSSRRRDKFDIASRQAAEVCPVKRLNAPGSPQAYEMRLIQVPGGEGSPLESELRSINPEGCRQRVVDNGDYDDGGIWLCQHEVGLYAAQAAELGSLAKLTRHVSHEQFARAVTVWSDPDEVVKFAPELAADSRRDGRCLLLTLGALGLARRDGSGQYLLDADGKHRLRTNLNDRIGKGWNAAARHIEADRPFAEALEAMVAEQMQRLGIETVRERFVAFRRALSAFVPHDHIEEAVNLLDEVASSFASDSDSEPTDTKATTDTDDLRQVRVGEGNGHRSRQAEILDAPSIARRRQGVRQ